MDDKPKVDIVDNGIERIPEEVANSNAVHETRRLAPSKSLVKRTVWRFGPNSVEGPRDDNETVYLRNNMDSPRK